jgi:YVTN family beta-propeller protein
MMFTSTLRLRSFSLTTICLSLLFIGGLNGAINTTQAQARAYVANPCNNTLAVVDTRTNTVVTTIPVGDEPYLPAVTPDGTRVYVTNRRSQTVSVINTATNTVVTTIPIGAPATAVVFTPDGTRAYVTTLTTIFVIDTSTNAVIATIPDRIGLTYVAITPDGTRIYVTHAFTLERHTVTVFNTATNAFVTSIDLPIRNPTGIAITPDGAHAYVATRLGETPIIDTATNLVTGSVPVGDFFQIAISPDGARAYGTGLFSSTVSVIDIATNTGVATIPVSGRSSTFLAVTADSARVYVSSGFSPGPIAVIDTATNTVVDEVLGIECSLGIAIAPPQFPQSKDDCKEGGYQRFGPPAFRNQGQCLKYVNEHTN